MRSLVLQVEVEFCTTAPLLTGLCRWRIVFSLGQLLTLVAIALAFVALGFVGLFSMARHRCAALGFYFWILGILCY